MDGKVLWNTMVIIPEVSIIIICAPILLMGLENKRLFTFLSNTTELSCLWHDNLTSILHACTKKFVKAHDFVVVIIECVLRITVSICECQLFPIHMHSEYQTMTIKFLSSANYFHNVQFFLQFLQFWSQKVQTLQAKHSQSYY